MKIAIVSLRPGTNYGGILQAWALQTVLERLGHEPTIIRKEFELENPLWLVMSKRLVHKYLLQRNIDLHQERTKREEEKAVFRHHYRFIEQRFRLRDINRFNQIKKSDYDAFVVGSDQIWRRRYLEGISRNVLNGFLQFARKFDVKRIAYAASFGVDQWEYSPEETAKISELLGLFDAVSVREESGIALCDKIGCRSAVQMPDPTMLLEAKDYESLIPADARPFDGDLFYYMLDKNEEKSALVRKVAEAYNMKAFEINPVHFKDLSKSPEKRVQAPVERWLQAFRDAKTIVTDSFHGCVFSILFKKPFVVIGNAERGMARFHSLLKTFGLEDRLLASVDDFNPSADYSVPAEVEEKLNALRNRALDFLRQNL